MLYSDSSSHKTLKKLQYNFSDDFYGVKKMRIWAFSVVLDIGATFSLRENISNRISLNNVPPPYS